MKIRHITSFLVLTVFTINNCWAQLNNQIILNRFQAVLDKVDKEYVKDVDKEKMLDAALNGMLTDLDPHSGYLNKDDLKDLHDQTKGEFGGVGIEVIYDSGIIKIISPIDDLPADRAGVQPGDFIVAVNDKPVNNLGFNKAIKKMRGKPGTKVHLTIVREGHPKPIELDLVREIVKIKPVKSHLDKDIAYLRVVTFNEHTATELKKATREIREKLNKKPLQGIILDLRNNPGGLLDQGILVSDYFLDEGIIVSTKGRTASSNSSVAASSYTPKAPKVPIVALVNSGTASAAEIVAGALQDHNRALILGTKSFGKGSVQTVFESNSGAVMLTTAKYYTPNGTSIQAKGIVPDVIVAPAEVKYDKPIKDEKRYSEDKLKNHLTNEEKNTLARKTQEEKGKKNPADNKKKDKDADSLEKMSEQYQKDYQYARAYDILQSLKIAKKLQCQK